MLLNMVREMLKGGVDVHLGSSDNLERSEHNPTVIAMLGAVGLNGVDIQLFDAMQQSGASVFVHGSLVSGRISSRSDVDFTVIGDIGNMPPILRDTLMPGAAVSTADYVSTSVRSQDGRKLSLHISESKFRGSYPDRNKPYATEYRSGNHAKKRDQSYFLSTVDRDGGIYLINFLCSSKVQKPDGSTLTDTPQTGVMVINGESVFSDEGERLSIEAREKIYIDPQGQATDCASNAVLRVATLGLEFDKMQSDIPLYSNAESEKRFVKDPTSRSMQMIADFTGINPDVINVNMFRELAKYWQKVKPHKQR